MFVHGGLLCVNRIDFMLGFQASTMAATQVA